MIQTRRRFLTVAACAASLPAVAATPPATRWRGTALGAAASLRIDGLDPAEGRAAVLAVQAELVRLEGVFSLYRADSALSRLNAARQLQAPPPELLELLSLADRLHRATGGAFDPSVQPVFVAHAKAAVAGRAASPAEIDRARAAVGWDGVTFDAQSVRLARPGAGLTLNGVAQGYIADRVAALLRARGLRDVLVDMGEVVGGGHRGDGADWEAGIATPDGTVVARVRLRDRALATSAPLGTVLDPAGRIGHIFAPATGRVAHLRRLAAVSAPRAAWADGLSTAFCLMPDAAVARAPARSPEWRSKPHSENTNSKGDTHDSPPDPVPCRRGNARRPGPCRRRCRQGPKDIQQVQGLPHDR